MSKEQAALFSNLSRLPMIKLVAASTQATLHDACIIEGKPILHHLGSDSRLEPRLMLVTFSHFSPAYSHQSRSIGLCC